DLLAPRLVDVDVAGGAGAGPAALGLDAGDEVLLGRLHHGHAGVPFDDLRAAVRLGKGDLGHGTAGFPRWAMGTPRRTGLGPWGGSSRRPIAAARSVSGPIPQIQALRMQASGGRVQARNK